MFFSKLVHRRKRSPRRSAHSARRTMNPAKKRTGKTHFGARLFLEGLEARLTPTVSVINNFDGLVGGGPPDTCGAAGPNSYIETINSSVSIFDKATGATIASDTLTDFLWTVGGIPKADAFASLADATMCYDEVIGRFIVADLDLDRANGGAQAPSQCDFAVSKSSNPTALDTNNWTFAHFGTSEGTAWSDYPGNIGYNHDALVFTWNMIGGDDVLVDALKQSDLANNAAGASHTYFDYNAYNLRPVTMHDSVAGDPMWFVTEHGDNSSIDLIRFDNILGSTINDHGFNVGVNSYGYVNNPLNPDGTPITTNTNESKIMKAAERNNTIVACQQVGVGTTENDARWYEFNVSNINSPFLVDEGNVSGGNNTYIMMPGIDINAAGDMGMSFIQSGTDTSSDFMSVYVTGRKSSDPAGTMETHVLVRAGDSNNGDGREGDFSGINVDPNGTFWIANEFTMGGSDATEVASFTMTTNDLTVSGVNITATAQQTFNGVVATLSDPDLSGSYTATITWGDGHTSMGWINANGHGNFNVSGSNTYAQAGPYTITVQISDSDGGSGTSNSTATVAPPNDLTVTGVDITAPAGHTFNGVVASIADPDQNTTGGTFQATINWGDGQSSNGVVTANNNGTYSVSGSNSYALAGSYSITVQITDGTNESGQASSTATVANPNDLTVTGVDITAPAGHTFNGVVATITDPDQGVTGGTFQATIFWGDGQSSNGVVTANNNGTYSVSGSHSYAQAGSYSIMVQVTDGTNESGQAFSTATITPPLVTPPEGIVGQIKGADQWWVGQSTGSSFVTTVWGALGVIPLVDVQTGDFNGDGKTDIIGRDLHSGTWWVGISTGSSFSIRPWATWSTAFTWVDVKVGDFDGDGTMDIAARALQSGQWWVGLSTGSSFVTTLWATWSTAFTWVDVNVGDFNGDGKADITGRALQSGQWWTALSTGNSFSTTLWATWYTGVTWVDVKVGDFNGDGKSDIIGRALQSGQWWVGISTGASFTTSLWDIWNPYVTWVDVQVGDFNGDGKDDIVGRVLQSGQWWVGISTGASFSTSLWATWSTAVTWVDVQVGDFNGDGIADITGRVLQNGTWWTGLSNGSGFTTSLWGRWSPSVSWADVYPGNFA